MNVITCGHNRILTLIWTKTQSAQVLIYTGKNDKQDMDALV